MTQCKAWFCTIATGLIVLGFLVGLSKLTGGIDIADVMRDAQAKTGLSPIIALGSDLGMYGWVSAIVVGLFCYRAAVSQDRCGKRHGYYLLAASGLSALLLLDDRLMLHEFYFPSRLGVDERVVIVGLVLCAAVFFAAGLRYHYLGGWWLLMTCAGFFAFSLGNDQLVQPQVFERWLGSNAYKAQILLEDGPKLIGIMLWLAFVVRAGFRVVFETDALAAAPEVDPARRVEGGVEGSPPVMTKIA